jgi:YD repeat-containing protein
VALVRLLAHGSPLLASRTAKTNTAIPTQDASTNRYNGYSYNEIGAVSSDGTYTFTYDTLGQPLSKEYNGDASTLEYYVYTPSNERIGIQRGTWRRWSVRDESGKVLRQYKSSSTNSAVASLLVEDLVWRDGLLLGSQRRRRPSPLPSRSPRQPTPLHLGQRPDGVAPRLLPLRERTQHALLD